MILGMWIMYALGCTIVCRIRKKNREELVVFTT